MPICDDRWRSILTQAWEWIAEGWFENVRCMGLMYVSRPDDDGAEQPPNQSEWHAADRVADH